MRKYGILLSATVVSLLAGCLPNLKPQPPILNPTAKTIAITEINNGRRDAGPHLTYIEINRVDAPDAAKPQSQYSVRVPGIARGGSWSSGPIPFSKFSTRSGLDLSSLTTLNLVVRVDAKNMVRESNERDNILDINQ